MTHCEDCKSRKKHKRQSKTIQFFVAILLAGGVDAIVQSLQGTADWRNFMILLISLMGIGLRLTSKHELV